MSAAAGAGRVSAMLVGVIFLRALFIMLGLGILHHDWNPAVPALGYWACVVLSLAITAVWTRPNKL
jgi:hypothetical protein